MLETKASHAILNSGEFSSCTCYGCGLANPDGLHCEILRDETAADRLVGRVRFAERHGMGVPGITHGGALWTVAACMACWVQVKLRGEGLGPLVRSGSLSFERPVPIDQDVRLIGTISKEGAKGDPIVVNVVAQLSGGETLAQGDFEVFQAPIEKLQRVFGVAKLPAVWEKLVTLGRN